MYAFITGGGGGGGRGLQMRVGVGGVEALPATEKASSSGMKTSFSLPAAGFSAAQRLMKRQKHA